MSVDLKVDWCSYQAAKYAVEHWHYSKRMPKSKLNMFGAWENDNFIGAVIFGVGATRKLVNPYGLKPEEGCELVRVALKQHITPVSKIVVKSIKLLKQRNEGLRIIVSFADPDEGHNGAIYQAMNWVHDGVSIPADEYIVNGKRWHGRSLRNTKPINMTTYQYAIFLDMNAKKIKGSSKIRYLYPLDKAMRRKILPLAKPYPKKEECGQSVKGDILTSS